MIRFQTLVERLEHAGIVRERIGSFDDLKIDHLANDSRKVGPNGLFVAISGIQADGHLFIDKAVQNGAIAVVCEVMPVDREIRFPGIAFVRVTNARAAIAELGAAFYGDPSDAVTMVGITGTNGKTTVSFLLHHVLMQLGRRAGLVGTVEVRIGEEVRATSLTTPDALDIYRLFREMADAGCDVCVMEVSSHALEQERTRAVNFNVAVFTNLTLDHLDYHKTFEAYLAAKKKLFDGLSKRAVAVYNVDDAAGAKMTADTKAHKLPYGLSGEAAVRVEIMENRIDGLRLRLDGGERRFRLVGRFNAYNLAAAYAVLTALQIGRSEALDALASAPAVPGRFEIIRSDNGKVAVIDYAHTPDALENVLQTIVETKPEDAALWCVFGCGGDRDKEKRPIMGSVAEKYADRVLVTSDNPRTEDPQSMIDDIRRGLAVDARCIVDRREAIWEAVSGSSAGDIILVAGKGHETYQIIGTEKLPFDDRAVVREAFQSEASSR